MTTAQRAIQTAAKSARDPWELADQQASRRTRMFFFAPTTRRGNESDQRRLRARDWLAVHATTFRRSYGIAGASIADVRAGWDAWRERRKQAIAEFRAIAEPYARELRDLAARPRSRRVAQRYRALRDELVEKTGAVVDELHELFPMTTIPPSEVVGRTPADEAEMIYAIAGATRRDPIDVVREVYGHLVDAPAELERFCQRECARFRAQIFGRRDALERERSKARVRHDVRIPTDHRRRRARK